MKNALWKSVRGRARGVRVLAAYMAIVFTVAVAAPGLAFSADSGETAAIQEPTRTPEPLIMEDPQPEEPLVPVELPSQELPDAGETPSAEPMVAAAGVALEPQVSISADDVLPPGPFSRAYPQFANEAGSEQWVNGDLNKNNSSYSEGMSVPQRLVMTGIATPDAGHSVTFEYAFTRAGKYAYDFITSWDQAVSAASNIAGQTWSQDWKWMGIAPATAAALDNYYVDVSIPGNGYATAKESAYENTLGYGDRTIRVYSDQPITNVQVSASPTLIGSLAANSSLLFTVTWDGPADGVMILYAAHVANGIDPYLPHSGIGWGAGMGAAGIPGSSYHNYINSSTEFSGRMDNQLKASDVAAMSGITGMKFEDLDGDGMYPPETGEAGLGGWEIWADLNDNGVYDAGIDEKTTTLADGTYGLYFYLPSQSATDVKVYEMPQAGWEQTYPTTAYHLVNVKPSEEDSGVDFGNWLDLQPVVTVTKTANPTSVPETGGSVTFTFRITNTGPVAFTVTSISDDKFGNLLATAKAQNGGADIVIPTTNPDSYYEFTYTATLSSDSLTAHKNVVTVWVADSDGDTDDATDDATVTFTDVAPVITVTKTANPTHIPEGGAYVTFTVTVANPGPEDVTLTSLIDDVFGDLTALANTNITLPQEILIGGSYSGWFTVSLASDTLTPHTNTVTGTAVDDDGTQVTAFDDATVTFDDTPPVIDVTKTVDDDSIPETGQAVTFTFRITNTGTESVTVTSILDDKFGNLLATAKAQNGGADIVIPATNPDSYYEFTYTTTLSSDSLTSHVNRVDVIAVDNDGTTATDYDTETVRFTDVAPTVSVQKVADPLHMIMPGGTFDYIATVTNNSPEPVQVMSVVDDIAGTVYEWADGDPEIWLDPQESRDFPFTWDHTEPGTYTNTVTTVVQDNDGSSDSDDAQATVRVTNPLISVVKTSDAPEEGIELGTPTLVTYMYVVENIGDVTLYDVVVTDDKLGVVGTIDVFPVDAIETFTKSTTLTDGVTNVVEAIGYDEYENEVSDEDTLTIDSYLRFTELDLAILKSASRSTAEPGDLVTYTLTYWNKGELPAAGYSITDDFDERYVTVVDAGGGVVSVGTITWMPAGSLALADGKKTLTYTVRINAEMPEGKTNVDNVVVIVDSRDADPSDNIARARVIVSEPFLPFTGGEYLLLLGFAVAAAAIGLLLRPRTDNAT